MKPIHEKAMPVILSDMVEQKLWLLEGDEELLRPFEGEMEFEFSGADCVRLRDAEIS